MIHLATQIIGEKEDGDSKTIILGIVLVMTAACSLHFGVEKPFLKLRDNILRKVKF